MANAPMLSHLGGLSELAGRSFASTREATDASLRLLTEQLGMRTSFLARVTPAEDRFEVLGAHNVPGGCGIEPGEALPLPGTY